MTEAKDKAFEVIEQYEDEAKRILLSLKAKEAATETVGGVINEALRCSCTTDKTE